LIRFGPHASNWVAQSPDNTLFMPFNIINMNGRIYDPMIGRMMSPDNYTHDDAGTQGYNRYSYANNNPLKFTDPDGNVWHIVIGAAIGGIANLGIKAWQGKIKNFGDGATAFGIGALAGGVIAATGGAAAVAASGTGAGSVAATAYAAAGGTGSIFLNSAAVGAASTGFVGGAIAGAAGTAGGSWILGLGNQHFFQDPYSLKQYGRDIIIGGVTGGVFGQVAKWLKNRSTSSGRRTAPERISPTPTPGERGTIVGGGPEQFVGADSYDALGNEFFNPDFGTRNQSSRFTHIFDQAADHNLDGLVSKFGTETNAYNAVDAAAQQALSDGLLTPNINGILPGISKGGSLLNVGGLNVWLNGGRIVNGRVIISSFTMRGF
jgi:RHS repeat-associated protein